jgi:hypothetical protein
MRQGSRRNRKKSEAKSTSEFETGNEMPRIEEEQNQTTEEVADENNAIEAGIQNGNGHEDNNEVKRSLDSRSAYSLEEDGISEAEPHRPHSVTV